MVAGPSGAGKSSLLRAGLVPALRDEAEVVLRTAEGIAAADVAGLCGTGPAVVIVDQFEEVFTGRSEADGAELIAALLDLPAAVVLALRADFYGRALRHPGLAEVLQTGQVVVTPWTRTSCAARSSRPRSGPGWSSNPASPTCCCAR